LNFVKILDQTPTRRTVKIGVVYVKKLQFQQQVILQNSRGSKDYQEFIEKLGKKIDLKNHLGYTAGLQYKTDRKKAIYYSNQSMEVVFQIVTMMPTIKKDAY